MKPEKGQQRKPKEKEGKKENKYSTFGNIK